MIDPASSNGPAIQSDFAGDPDMGELVELFLQELPERMKVSTEAWTAGDLKIVQRVAHQLRGSSAGYGFPSLGLVAGEVEDTIRTPQPPLTSPTPELEAVYGRFRSIAARVMAGAARKAA